jgi:putative flippase GtrA
VPVDWIDDVDSRVHIARTALDDLRGTLRVARSFAAGRGNLELGPTARPPLDDDLGRRFVRFATIGAVSTAVSLLIYLATRRALGPIGANAVAVSATCVGNAWANARFTSGRRRPQWRAAGALYVGSLAVTSAALALVARAGGGSAAELAVLLVTWIGVAACRFAIVRSVPTRTSAHGASPGRPTT